MPEKLLWCRFLDLCLYKIKDDEGINKSYAVILHLKFVTRPLWTVYALRLHTKEVQYKLQNCLCAIFLLISARLGYLSCSKTQSNQLLLARAWTVCVIVYELWVLRGGSALAGFVIFLRLNRSCKCQAWAYYRRCLSWLIVWEAVLGFTGSANLPACMQVICGVRWGNL